MPEHAIKCPILNDFYWKYIILKRLLNKIWNVVLPLNIEADFKTKFTKKKVVKLSFLFPDRRKFKYLHLMDFNTATTDLFLFQKLFLLNLCMTLLLFHWKWDLYWKLGVLQFCVFFFQLIFGIFFKQPQSFFKSQKFKGSLIKTVHVFR